MNQYIIVLMVIVFIVAIYTLLYFNSDLRLKAYKYFLIAENKFKKGDDKMDYVVNEIYSYLPVYFKILPISFYRWLLQLFFDGFHDFLDDGILNRSNAKRNS